MTPRSALDPPPRGGLRRPGWRFLLAHPAHLVALGFGSGLAPVAPGTAGTLWAWLVYVGLQPPLDDLGRGLVLVAATAIGWWACTVTARHLGQADPSAIVWDEVVAFWLVLWLVPAGWLAQAVAFALFRVFDAAKPGPVAWADQRFKLDLGGGPIGWRQGFGILFDDFVAALCTLLVMAVWQVAAQWLA